MDCNCLGCQNIAKLARKPRARECFPTELYYKHFNQQENTQLSENCIPKPVNINKRYDRDVNTSDLYRTQNIPDRFEHPCNLNGYGSQWKQFHPIFHTTSSEYGWIPPSAHTVPHRYYPRSTEFSELLSKSGMYRNYSLNTMLDKTRV